MGEKNRARGRCGLAYCVVESCLKSEGITFSVRHHLKSHLFTESRITSAQPPPGRLRFRAAHGAFSGFGAFCRRQCLRQRLDRFLGSGGSEGVESGVAARGLRL